MLTRKIYEKFYNQNLNIIWKDYLNSKEKTESKSSKKWIKILIPLVGIGGFGAVAIFGAFFAFIITAWWGQPIPILGFDQTVEQPISFPHTIHASTNQLEHVSENGDPIMGLGMDCTFCHRTVTKQKNAGVPPVALCTTCHSVVGSKDSIALSNVRKAGGIEGNDPQPINWKRVHRMPDHVRFVHEPHIRYLLENPEAIENTTSGVKEGAAGVCSTCHGDVASMEQVAQVEALKMGQCVDCHRDNGAPTDCAVCHH